MQGRVISEVLHDGQIEIERAGLEDDAKPAQRFSRSPSDIVAKDAD